MAQGVAYSFTVEMDGVQMDHVQEVSGLSIEIEKVEQYENNAKGKLIRNVIPGVHKGQDVTITKLLDGEDKAWKTVMIEAYAGSPTAHKQGAVTIKDSSGEDLISITIPPSLITKIEGSASKANDTSIRTQKITLATSGLTIGAADLLF